MYFEVTQRNSHTIRHAIELAMCRGTYTNIEQTDLKQACDALLLDEIAEPCEWMRPNTTGPRRDLLVELRDVYGKPTVYPLNQAALTIAQLARATTLTPAALAGARTLGFTVREVYNRPLPG